MRAVLCKNVPAMRDFRDVICPAAWKNPGSVCEHVAPFPVFPEIFSDFLPFGGGILVGISQPGEEKWPFSRNSSPLAVIKLAVSGKFLFSCWQKMAILGKFLSFGWHKIGRFLGNFRSPVGKKRRFLENFCPSDDIKLTVPGEQIRKIRDFFGDQERIFSGFSFRSFKKISLIADKFYRVSVVSSRRERFFRRFFRVRSCNSFMCACFFLFVCTCARMCAYTRSREIHNVGLFPSVFESIKKRSPATVLFTAVYKKSSKFPQKSIA
jgi:hypothetical protein